jgi:hypothetical protein
MKFKTKKSMLMQSTITTEATIKTPTEAIKIQVAEGDTHLLEEVTGDLKIALTTAIKEPYQINLIRRTCLKLMCKEIFRINAVTAKTPRPFVQIESIKGIQQNCLLDTGAGLKCMSTSAFRKINKECKPKKISAIGSKAQEASGNALLPERVYMIPMEWNGKKLCKKYKYTKIWNNQQSWELT